MSICGGVGDGVEGIVGKEVEEELYVLVGWYFGIDVIKGLGIFLCLGFGIFFEGCGVLLGLVFVDEF